MLEFRGTYSENLRTPGSGRGLWRPDYARFYTNWTTWPKEFLCTNVSVWDGCSTSWWISSWTFVLHFLQKVLLEHCGTVWNSGSHNLPHAVEQVFPLTVGKSVAWMHSRRGLPTGPLPSIRKKTGIFRPADRTQEGAGDSSALVWIIPHGCGTLFSGPLYQDVCVAFVMNKNSTRLNRTVVCSLHDLIKTPHMEYHSFGTSLSSGRGLNPGFFLPGNRLDEQ